MKRDNKVCICCGTTYKYCSGCAEYAGLPQWKNIYDKIECKVIFDVATDYNGKHISKEEAKAALEEYDITGIKLNESLAEIIKEILGSKSEKAGEKPVVKEVEKKEEKSSNVSAKEDSFLKNKKK